MIWSIDERWAGFDHNQSTEWRRHRVIRKLVYMRVAISPVLILGVAIAFFYVVWRARSSPATLNSRIDRGHERLG
jgi:hypothetical protein